MTLRNEGWCNLTMLVPRSEVEEKANEYTRTKNAWD